VVRRHPGPDDISPLLFRLMLEAGYPDDLVEVQLMVEPAFSIMTTMERVRPEDYGRIRSALSRLERSVRSGRPAAEDGMVFHLAILKAAKTSLVIHIGETIFRLFRPSINVSMQHIATRAIRDHQCIFKAFHSGDAARLRATVVRISDG